MTAPVLLLPVLADKRANAWPEHPQGRPALYLKPAEVFERHYPTDAHYAAYSVPRVPRRLATQEAIVQLADQGGVPMVLAVFDLDAPAHQATEAWLEEQLPKFDALWEPHPGMFVYRTRGGYRLLWQLDEPFVLRDLGDAARWRRRYQRWCCYLARRFDLVADPSCADWTRLYRAPHATREPDGQPEQLPVWGYPGELGPWGVEPAGEDIHVDVALARELGGTWKLWAPVARALAGEVGQGEQPPLPAAGFEPEYPIGDGEGGEPPPMAGPGGGPLPIKTLNRFFNEPPHMPGPGGADRSRRRAEGYARHALERAAEELRATSAGQGRNNVLNAKAFALGRFVGAGLVGEEDVFQVLLGAARAAGLPEVEARATLRSGLQGGRAQPRLPDLADQPGLAPQGALPNDTYKGAPFSSPSLPHRVGEPARASDSRNQGTLPSQSPGVRGAVQVLDPWAFNTTDLGNAERLVARHGADLRYCHPWQKWLVWDGCRWRVDGTAEVHRRARETARSIYAEAAAIPGTDQAAELRRKELGAWARRVEARDRLSALVDLARSDGGIAILPDQLDVDPWLLNCRNGTLDLRTGELLPHQRERLLTKLAPVAYDPGATCPTWLAFLDVILRDDVEVIGFLQRFVGYALTGVIREHVLVTCYGTGSNGKGTFLGTLLQLVGDYAWQGPPDLLLSKNAEGHPTDLTGLFGVRFAACSETDSGRHFSEARLKNLTGGDRITARRMREDFWSFDPTHKLALATNHRPVIKSTDHGIWRRQRLVPFTVTIPDHLQDKQLPEKLRAELPGILRWALEGCLAWQRDGLGDASAIRQATEAWRDESDVIGGFLEACCERGPRAIVPAKELYARYLAYCEVTREEPLKQNPFGHRLTEKGFMAIRGGKGARLWRGLKLAEAATDPGTPGEG
jgi:P4 family phage/plasmid primase-like protien